MIPLTLSLLVLGSGLTAWWAAHDRLKAAEEKCAELQRVRRDAYEAALQALAIYDQAVSAGCQVRLSLTADARAARRSVTTN